ncbi:hypothetical protein M8818_005084 [Zalaria obscura]|uniref:Uncharacterized protein n=1 Tax=Zalaria obscura TaxID=2024903 RepID=A0ACC3SA48_9PEZI
MLASWSCTPVNLSCNQPPKRAMWTDLRSPYADDGRMENQIHKAAPLIPILAARCAVRQLSVERLHLTFSPVLANRHDGWVLEYLRSMPAPAGKWSCRSGTAAGWTFREIWANSHDDTACDLVNDMAGRMHDPALLAKASSICNGYYSALRTETAVLNA